MRKNSFVSTIGFDAEIETSVMKHPRNLIVCHIKLVLRISEYMLAFPSIAVTCIISYIHMLEMHGQFHFMIHKLQQ